VDEILHAGASAWSRSGNRADVATGHLRSWWRSREHAFSRGLHEYWRVDSSGREFRIGYIGAPHGTGGGRYDVIDPVRRRVVASPPADWVVAEPRMKQLIAEDRVDFHDDHDRVPSRKLFLDEMTTQAPLPTFEQRRDAGPLRLRHILGEHRFDHPKDPQVLARWFRIMAGPDALILDFFAGSGTTADAVMLLNSQDGGSRRSVLITTNEVAPRDVASLAADGAAGGDDRWDARGVFRNVLRPRIETLLSGIRPNGSMFSAGLPETVEFFRMTEA
jgi:adenine-specific DNA-methyltransferase